MCYYCFTVVGILTYQIESVFGKCAITNPYHIEYILEMVFNSFSDILHTTLSFSITVMECLYSVYHNNHQVFFYFINFKTRKSNGFCVEEDRKVVCVYVYHIAILIYLPIFMSSDGFYFVFGTISNPR